MGKRSDFKRVERDYYRTPLKAVLPLLPHLVHGGAFCEPCAGDGALVDHLQGNGHRCVWESDIEPKRTMWQADALSLTYLTGEIITNPPWDRKLLHPMIDYFRNQLPTWLLFDADWAHTRQSAPFMPYCAKIVSVGRVRWIEDSKMDGKDNCAWYLFGKHQCATVFYGRQA